MIVIHSDVTSCLQERNVAYSVGAVCNVPLLLYLVSFCSVRRKRQSAVHILIRLRMGIRGISVRFLADIILTSVKLMSVFKVHQTVSQRVQGVTSQRVNPYPANMENMVSF